MGALQLLAGFYEEVKPGKPQCGDVYWVPVPFVDEVPRVLEILRADPRSHTEMEFVIEQVQQRHFKNRDDRLPLKLLQLESTEEAVVARAKKRPAIVICNGCITDASGLSTSDQRLARELTRDCYIVAPMYSTATPAMPGMFMPCLVARVRAMKYAHLSCLPPLGKNERVPGEIVRLDRIMATHLSRGCDHTGFRLHPEARALLQNQLLWFARGEVNNDLATVIELARSAFPEESKTL
jgi:hypothetical protein